MKPNYVSKDSPNIVSKRISLLIRDYTSNYVRKENLLTQLAKEPPSPNKSHIQYHNLNLTMLEKESPNITWLENELTKSEPYQSGAHLTWLYKEITLNQSRRQYFI